MFRRSPLGLVNSAWDSNVVYVVELGWRPVPVHILEQLSPCPRTRPGFTGFLLRRRRLSHPHIQGGLCLPAENHSPGLKLRRKVARRFFLSIALLA